jgi:predicted ATP-grasp superfamily ATP-dependent carboligase
VLGIDSPIGLTVVRELGQRGVEVHGVARSRQGVGLYSRYLARGYVCPPREDATVPLLRSIAAATGGAMVMAVSEPDILLLNRASGALAGLRLLVPDAQRMARVLDKATACEAARAVGIEVPETFEVAPDGNLEPILAAARYPVVLKWRDPQAVGAALARAGLPLQKAEYCYDPETLRTALGRYRPVGCYPLVQSFCPGYGIGHMVLMYRDEPILRFQHRRVHEWPPEGGFATMAVSVGLDEHAALFERSVALLRRLEWVGPAMVEYRFDPASGRAVFMEVNGRFWGSLPLAHHAGAHFAWATYSALGRGVVPPAAPYRVGVTCRFMIPELRRLFTILFRPGRVQDRALRFDKGAELLAFVATFLRPRQHYYVFAWKDPLPAVADLWFVAVKALGTLRSALRRRRVGAEEPPPAQVEIAVTPGRPGEDGPR